MDANLDMNVANYTLSELMLIAQIEDMNEEDIIHNTNIYIKKYKKSNPPLSVFFKEIQSQLLQYIDTSEEDSEEDDDDEAKIHVEGFSQRTNDFIFPSGDKQISEWYQNENLTQSNPTQSDKITDRKQKIQLFGNEKAVMKQEQIATTDTFTLPVKQDSLNPNLKNTISRFINLDSQFRQYTSGSDSGSTNYTCDLSDTLKNTLSISVYSYQIPFSWYTIDPAYGNTCFWVYDSSSNYTIAVSIPAGNYSQVAFQSALNNSFTSAGFAHFPIINGSTTPVNYNASNGLLTMYLNGSIWTDPDDSNATFTVTTSTQFIFYDFTGNLQCNINCHSKSKQYFNNTLGWIMGYRLPYINVSSSGNTASSILDLNGTKYLILSIDDYNQNHINNSLVSISQFNNTLKMPSYPTDIPHTCITPEQQTDNLNELVAGVVTDALFTTQSFNAVNGLFNQPRYSTTLNNVNGLLIGGKYQREYTPTSVALPSAPRTLTNAQLYTINSIHSNNNNLTNYLAKPPTTSDILAIIPVKTSAGVPTGSLLVEFSGSLQDNTRTYFGPVNIERMAIKLLDDKGNVLNLNGNDWCVSLIAECLYQY
jgi:hypothetical protein